MRFTLDKGHFITGDITIDRRTAYTKMVIKEALYELLEKKHLSQITVKEICEKAEINRATFYRNYGDIYGLYGKLEEELTEGVFADDNIETARYKLLELLYEYQAFYMEIKRDIYLNKLINKKHNGLIKVVTGICHQYSIQE